MQRDQDADPDTLAMAVGDAHDDLKAPRRQFIRAISVVKRMATRVQRWWDTVRI
jgi:hypothetical protein